MLLFPNPERKRKIQLVLHHKKQQLFELCTPGGIRKCQPCSELLIIHAGQKIRIRCTLSDPHTVLRVFMGNHIFVEAVMQVMVYAKMIRIFHQFHIIRNIFLRKEMTGHGIFIIPPVKIQYLLPYSHLPAMPCAIPNIAIVLCKTDGSKPFFTRDRGTDHGIAYKMIV